MKEIEEEGYEKRGVGLKRCPTCGKWDVYRTYVEDGGFSYWCPNCKKSIEKGYNIEESLEIERRTDRICLRYLLVALFVMLIVLFGKHIWYLIPIIILLYIIFRGIVFDFRDRNRRSHEKWQLFHHTFENYDEISSEEAADLLQISVSTLRKYARNGVIPAFKAGREWRFKRKELMDWYQEGE